MKTKFLIFVFALMIGLSSCMKHDVEPYNAQGEKQSTFARDFANEFSGATIEANHLWGTDVIPMVSINQSTTRTAQPNGNQWGTNDDNGKYKDYPKPAAITEQELNDVLAVFNDKGKESYEPLIHIKNFFIQQVYTGPNGWKMNELATTVDYTVTTNVISWWPYQAETVVNQVTPYDDIINNFNAGNCTAWDGCMLMWNSATEDFSFKTSQSGGERIYKHWRMEKINGNYYVGFDHEAWRQAPANANEEDKRDYVYNDWIIKIVPGVGEIIPNDIERVRIMAEDLGADHSDFDYNDVVFDIKFIKDGNDLYADIIVQAAGGTLPLKIGDTEVHALFEQSIKSNGKYPMINTGPGADVNGLEPKPLYFKVGRYDQFQNAWQAINALPISVQLENQQVITLTVNPGSPAEMIAVPTTVNWSNERVSIKNKYPNFVNWISDSSIIWWEE